MAPAATADVRAAVDGLLEAGDAAAARALMAQLWALEPRGVSAGFILARLEPLRRGSTLVAHRVALLRSATVEPIVPLLRAEALVHGADLTVAVGGFNAWAQELLDPASAIYADGPDTVILAVESRDLVPDLWYEFTAQPAPAVEDSVQRALATIEDCVRAFRSRSRAHLVVHTLELPAVGQAGILDAQSPSGQSSAIRRLNEGLLGIARRTPGVFLLDYEALVGRHGKLRWHDERKWLTARLPVSADHLSDLAHEWCRYVLPLAGRACKALVVDLDNTLWGGTIGEDGIEGIRVGAEYPGAAFRGLQRAILDLFHRGVILAVCSKNNPADALHALQTHPGMLLRPEHFAAQRINWLDKADNVRAIAEELNIGLDAVAFLDDNPAERQRIRTALPDVTVIELSDDPMLHADRLRGCPLFERLALSDEDRDRGRYYAEQRARSERQRGAGSLDEYLESLAMIAEVSEVAPDTIQRAAQLTQKTNQFNVTTRRYTEQQIADLAGLPDSRVYLLRLRDRFGDNGIVGLAIVRDRGHACELDSFLLSCRVIGRRAETALLATIAEEARGRGRTRLVGAFVPTPKNGPARSFYSSHGFACTGDGPDGSRWEFDLAADAIAAPACITRRTTASGVAQ